MQNIGITSFSPSFNGSVIIKGKKLIEKQNGKDFLPKLLDSEAISRFRYGRNFIFSQLIIKPIKEGTIAWKIKQWKEISIRELANNLSAPWQLSAKNRETLTPDFMRAYINDYHIDDTRVSFAELMEKHFSRFNVPQWIKRQQLKRTAEPYTIFSAIKQIWNRPKKSRIDRIIADYEKDGQKLVAVRNGETPLLSKYIEIETDKVIHRMPLKSPLDYYQKTRVYPDGYAITKESLENIKIRIKYIKNGEGVNTSPDVFWTV